ncbi:MAG: hypothetical protein AB2540_12170 [Candidatus Thiodiazotropha endolucinida]
MKQRIQELETLLKRSQVEKQDDTQSEKAAGSEAQQPAVSIPISILSALRINPLSGARWEAIAGKPSIDSISIWGTIFNAVLIRFG